MRTHLDRLSPGVVLVGLTVLGLLVRLLGLGARVAHQDEARVASWILHYVAVDAWEYRPIIHGPFLPHVNGAVFELLGPSDFSMRLVVAVVGGLLPLSAWLLRDRLRDREVLFLGALLSFNPILVYYSRFMRNDVLLGAFGFLAAAFVVRAIDTNRRRYLFGAAVAFALALTTKENALLYPVTWAGTLVLLLDHRLFHSRYDDGWWDTLRRISKRIARALWQTKYSIFGSLLALLVVVVAFYAPKPEFYQALGAPSQLPAVLETATLGTWEKFAELWGSTGMQEHSYVTFLLHLLGVVAVGGLTTMVFAAIGFLADRYGNRYPRDLVAVGFFWGLASLLGYPIVSDIKAGWTAVHVLIPLMIPAAVGLSVVLDRAELALRRNQRQRAAVAIVLLLGAATVLAGSGVAINAVYPADERNPVVQYAQPAGDMKPTLEEIETIAAENEGIDVMFYGEEFYSPNETEHGASLDIETGGYAGWFDRLPLPWYLEQYDARVGSTETPAEIAEHDPPVIITLEEETGTLQGEIEGYEKTVHQGYLHDRPIVFYVRS
ncbi:TIGR03663 family protein [Halodesulfurarchaeum sp. HSR-GB]|uniref:flippase activity-associated protein Agl23 n=1 Tax=Halodesulfurarchaeum sp. HSR-GB TaxID=3074077 RepID=UPI00285B1F07|nr:flippase activity-associated protein Agl23 [Halodesulfurarchaeum sp. HSR-GB]MDR5656309.1 TIGR03663 family protein [Halodesulfurarchaeum sp. HSR-GB]